MNLRPNQPSKSYEGANTHLWEVVEWTEEHGIKVPSVWDSQTADPKGSKPVESPYGPAQFDIFGPQYGINTSSPSECVESSHVQIASSKTANSIESPYGVPEFDIFGPQYGMTPSKASNAVETSYTEVSYAQVTTPKSIKSVQSPYGTSQFDLFGPQFGLTSSTSTKQVESSSNQTAVPGSIEPKFSPYDQAEFPLYGPQYGIPGLSLDDDYYNVDDGERCIQSKSTPPPVSALHQSGGSGDHSFVDAMYPHKEPSENRSGKISIKSPSDSVLPLEAGVSNSVASTETIKTVPEGARQITIGDIISYVAHQLHLYKSSLLSCTNQAQYSSIKGYRRHRRHRLEYYRFIHSFRK